jgi:hypothetical protein
MTDFNPTVLLAFQRARTRTIAARAEAALARLGNPSQRSPSSLSDELCAGLSASQIERDAKSLRNILRVWKLTGKGGPGSTIQLPSGRTFRAPGNANPDRIERAVMRTPKHLRPKRRHHG